MFKLVASLVAAVTIYLKVLPLLHLNKLYKDLDDYEDEIFKLGDDGDASSKLQLELVASRKFRTHQQIESVRSLIDNS